MKTKKNVSENDSFRDRLREIIIKLGSQEKLAFKSGISKSTISKYILGLSDPTRKKLIALACAGDVSVEWLITGANEMDNNPRDTVLISTIMEIAEEIIECNKIAITPEKKVKSIMSVYLDMKDDAFEYDYDEEKIKKKLWRYLDVAK